MKVLVTGHKGFIGSAYYRAIQEQHEVTGLDIPEHDLVSPSGRAKIIDLVSKHDLVIHISAVADLNDTAREPYYTFSLNVESTYWLAMQCAEYNKKFIFISTCCVYGNTTDHLQTEETYPKTIEPYAVSKVSAEYLIQGIQGLEYVILRLGTVYGMGMREALFTYIALDKVARGQTIQIHGSGEQTRQYIYIDDLVAGMARATNYFDLVQGEIINLCGIEHSSVLDVIRHAENVVGAVAKTTHVDDRYGQIYSENISIEKAYTKLHWQPSQKLSLGMEHVYHNDIRFARVEV